VTDHTDQRSIALESAAVPPAAPRAPGRPAPASAPAPRPQLLDDAVTGTARWVELPARRPSVAEARHRAGAWLRSWTVGEEIRDAAVLVLSELATNAIRHTPSAHILCCVALRTDALVHLEVHDDDATPHSLTPCHPTLDDERGRGLLLVEHMTERWGVTRSTITGGNVVWATLEPGP
jgi:anti-sigma regulatory factor (Ser/Thr protein kinase)